MSFHVTPGGKSNNNNGNAIYCNDYPLEKQNIDFSPALLYAERRETKKISLCSAGISQQFQANTERHKPFQTAENIMALITHQGISEAIANLQPNPATLKGRLINLVHSYFPTEESLGEIDSIAPEYLIRQLWEVEDPEGIRQKKKNLSSLKSSINKDLKNLARQGKNPEGLIIGRENVFTISDEHKNDLLQKLGLSGPLDPKDLLSLISGILDTVMQGDGRKEAASSLLKEFDKTREMIAKAAGISDDQTLLSTGGETAEAAAGSSVDGAVAGTAADGSLAGVELIGPGYGAGAGAAGGDELPEDEEIEILEEAEILEEEPVADELPEADELEVLDEAEILEEEAEIVDEAASVPGAGLAEGELTGPGYGAGGEATGGAEAEPAADELPEDEELEVLDEAEILEEEAGIVDEEASAPGAGLAGGELTGPGYGAGGEATDGAEAESPADELPEADELEVLDEEEILEAEPAADELLEDAELELLDEAEILAEKAEIVDEDEITPVADEIGATDDAKRDAARPLDLSHYIEPDEALASPPETLTETHDDYIAQILERFMPKFIKIPAGYYRTGRDQPAYNERPARKIFLQSFYIGQLPVTNDLFDFFVRETGYETDAEKTGFGNVVEGRISNRIDPHTGRTVLSINRGTRSQRMQGANWRHPSGSDSSLENKGNHPVVQVSRQDALAFAAWAGKRLPSEDEWEAAARGHEGLLFPWGKEWHRELTNTESSLTGDTTPVIRHGKPSMSPFGVYDLLGNVFEWTATVHTPSRPVSNRTPPVYVLKGGCWTSKTGIAAAARLLEPDTWSNTIGFRCAV
jgi:formylglycine-generating enzyme required for sulfatase activity